MVLINPQKENNFLIFGSWDALHVAPFLRGLKYKGPDKNFCYISAGQKTHSSGIVVTTIDDQLEVMNSNMTFPDLFRHLSKEVFGLIESREASFDIGCNITMVFDAFFDIDIQSQDKLVNADYSKGPPELSKVTMNLGGRPINDIEIFNFKNLHEFDGFVTHMTTFKGKTINSIIEPVKYGVRLLQ